MRVYDYIVIGGGAMGTATAYQLARDGRETLLLEQFEPGHDRGSTHGHSRIIRLSYEIPEYVRLMRRAYGLWAELEQDAAEQLLTRTGGIDLGRPDEPLLRQCIASLEAEGVPHEVLDADEIRRRYPQIRPADDWVGLYQGDAGILPPTRVVLAMARMARAYGATIRERTPVRSIRPLDGEVEVATAGETLRCRRLVVTAGAWAQSLLRQVELEVPLAITQEQIAFFAPAEPELFQPGRLPIFINYGDPPLYGFPVFGLAGVKVAEHHGGPQIALEQYDQQVRPEPIERLRSWLERYLPGAAGPVLHARTCLYTNTPDHHFIIDHHPAYSNIVIGAGFSGHGFKFTALIGRLLADLAQERELPAETELFSLARFSPMV